MNNNVDNKTRSLTDIEPKVAAAGTAGSLVVLILFVAKALGLEGVDETVASALVVVIATAAGYLKKSK